MKTNITPGPWGYWPNSAYPEGVISESGGGHITRPTQRPEITANAQAIAAVPEMIDALIRADGEIKEWLDSKGIGYDLPVLHQIEAALKKAGVEL